MRRAAASLIERGAPPSWFRALLGDQTGRWERLVVREWDEPCWRAANGWRGTDFVHGAPAAVHIPDYVLDRPAAAAARDSGTAGARLVGAAHFGAGAESHQGLCHGGTMTALMDDVIGWTGFCVAGPCAPWSGFTVQVNTSLKAPVRVGSWLRVEGVVTKREGRKVWVRASLTTPGAADGGEGEPTVHCEAEGLFLVKRQ